MHKRLPGVLIVCFVFVSVILSLSSKQKTVFGEYGDRNKHTLAAEKWVEENKLNDIVLAVFEGERDTVALFTVSDKWNTLDKNKRHEVTSTLLDLWFDIRNSLNVVIVDINGNELADADTRMTPPPHFQRKKIALSEKLRKQIFTDLVAAQDKATMESERLFPDNSLTSLKHRGKKYTELAGKYEAGVRAKYGITKEVQKQIIIEAVKKEWPLQ